MKIQSFSLQGRRRSNEDQHFHLINLDNTNRKLNKVNFVGVFDGHGGKLVSKYLKKNLPKFFINKIKRNMFKNTKETSNYIKNIFDLVQQNLIKYHPRASSYCGSTALCGIQTLDSMGKKSIWVTNVGDSRAVLCKRNNQAKALSEDHKPNSRKEKKRIGQLGGSIEYDGSDWRIKGLSLSRAFGDVEATPYVSHRPDIFKYKLCKDDKFIIFACDGLWDVLSNQKAVDYVNKLINKRYSGNIAKALAEHAYNIGSYDNVTAVVMFL
jgi:serine/threonine protein phosphatase PrpC